MRPWLAIPLAPVLALTIAHGAQASAAKSGHHHHAARQASAAHAGHHRHGARTLALHQRGHSHHRQVADSDGWNPADAGVSAPTGAAPAGGAMVQKVSYQTGADTQTAFNGNVQTGVASYYGGRHNGRRTASGEIFNEHAMTAAHRSLPFGTKVLVQIPGTDHSVVVTITDRLFARHRIIDLSEGAAQQLGIMRAGTSLVMLTPQG